MKTQKLLVFPLLIAILACNFVGSQELSPLATPSQPNSTEFITFTPSLVPTNTSSPTPDSSERSCTSEDFRTPSTPPNINEPETLIGFQPSRGWRPSVNWKLNFATHNFDFDYSLVGYETSDQYLFVIKKPICRYDENKYSLSEVKDYILLSNLNENEVIFDSVGVTSGNFYRENISKRLNFTWEMHTVIRCADSDPRAIMMAKYNINEFPEKIESGTQITFVVFRGWLPNPSTYKFEEFDAAGISCTILFSGM